MLERVASDEARHFNFYRRIFKGILEIDPNRALESLLSVVPKLQMPGVTIPHFKEMADVVRRSGIYGPWDYKEIVERALEFWKIGVLTGLSEKGRQRPGTDHADSRTPPEVRRIDREEEYDQVLLIRVPLRSHLQHGVRKNVPTHVLTEATDPGGTKNAAIGEVSTPAAEPGLLKVPPVATCHHA